MTYRDDLMSVLQLGWDASRRAWRLLAPGQETTFSPDLVGVTGRDLDQLAYDLRRLGLGKPARMAFSVAFILNGLAGQSIRFDRELADKTSQIIAVLAEMLLELESTSEITIEEPVEIVEQLRVRCGLVVYADDHQANRLPRPHFRHPNPAQAPFAAAHPALVAIGEELVWVSESLLSRVSREGEFPHVTALGRIHHLGKTLLDKLVALQIPQPAVAAEVSLKSPTIESPHELAQVDVVAEDDASPLAPPSIAATVPRRSNQIPRVLVVDDSPFFRMLLSTAVSAAGYATQVVASPAEARGLEGADSWDMIICDHGLAHRDAEFGRWVQERIVAGNGSLITLVDRQTETEIIAERQTQVRRTDISGLLNAIKSDLGPAPAAMRMSA